MAIQITERQHFVPRAYLKYFADKKGSGHYNIMALTIDDLTPEAIIERNTKSICYEKNLYTLPGSTNEEKMLLEKFYSEEFENKYEQVYTMLTDPSKLELANSVYQVNKGINQSIEFKGLKAQYIWYLGGCIVALLILFAILYFIGLPSLLCVGIIATIGTIVVIRIYSMSNKYGEHGLMKALARKQVPRLIRCNSRRVFVILKKN